MIFNIYAVRDELLGFGAPVIRDNDAVAVRAFDNDVNFDNSPYAKHPNDYSLFHIGEFDTDSGDITASTPRFVATASDFIGG